MTADEAQIGAADRDGQTPSGWHVEYVAETGSTNADLFARAAHGAPSRTVLVAEVQTHGRGRLGRSWVAPAGTALMFSVLLRVDRVPPAKRGWIGALTGMALVRGIRRRTGVRPALKWPNDVLLDGRKIAGILAEMADDALVVGAGVNVTLRRDELPRPDATSLRLAGVDEALLDRSALLTETLSALDPLLTRWQAAGGEMDAAGLREEYLAMSATVGSMVSIEVPDGRVFHGRAVDVTPDGAIVLGSGGSILRFSAGDVRHLRATSPAW